jgi:2-polyprenyl-3-methyl-5-hydroxy-6-metoxy-1,4-benzoquinol methylase
MLQSRQGASPVSHAPNEHQRLAAIAADSWYGKGINATTVAYSVRIFSRHWRPGSCLELGPAEGLATASLVNHFDDLTCVDGSDIFCHALTERHPGIHVVCSLFEHYDPARTFDNVVLGHVLEHVEDPVAILQRAKTWLNDSGRIFASVPNARSLHRQMGVVMNLLAAENSLNALDQHHGHRRVYDPESIRHDFNAAGLRIEIFGGYWIKPASNAHLEAHWTSEMLEAAMVVGERYPDIAAEIYVIAGR